MLVPLTSSAASEPVLYEIPGTQVVPISNSATDWRYELYIKLPESYSQKRDKKYPVIYFTDAMWHIELLSAATTFLMEDVILVGISWQTDIDEKLKNEVGKHVSRYRDYSSEKSTNADNQAKYQFGQAKSHLSFIRNDVIKYVEKNYRTMPNDRTYFGYSLGGEFGAYTLLAQPDTFKNYILGSPSLKGNISYLSKLASNTHDSAQDSKRLPNRKVFVSYGALETELGKYAEEFIHILKTQRAKSVSLQHFIAEGGHQAAFPMTGVQGITWLSEQKTKI